MAIIGTFKPADDGGYTGQLKTLALDLKQVRFQPVRAETPNSPDFRILSGDVEVGAGWKKTARDGGEYVSVRLDDPSFVAPVYATLVAMADGMNLVWSRRIAGD